MHDLMIRERYLFDDKIEYGFTKPLVPVTGNPYAVEIQLTGEKYGLTMETCYSPQHEKYVIFARNGRGFRWIFLFVEDPKTKRFRPLDRRTVTLVREILWYNQDKKRFFKDMREQRIAQAQMKDYKEKEEFDYVCSQHQRLFRMLSRSLGYTHGKTRLPY